MIKFSLSIAVLNNEACECFNIIFLTFANNYVSSEIQDNALCVFKLSTQPNISKKSSMKTFFKLIEQFLQSFFSERLFFVQFLNN